MSGSARARHIAVLLDPSRILIAGGTTARTPEVAIKYDAAELRRRARASPTWRKCGQLHRDAPEQRQGPGRRGATGVLTAELFNPAGTPGSEFSSTGALPAGEDKRFHTAVLLNGLSPKRAQGVDSRAE